MIVGTDMENPERLCPSCDEFWPRDTEFWPRNRSKPDGMDGWCRACTNEYAAERRAHAATLRYRDRSRSVRRALGQTRLESRRAARAT